MKTINFSSVTDVFKPQDQEEEKILRRIGAWTVKLFEHRARAKGLIPYENVLEESRKKFGNLLGERLIQLRKKRELTQKELSKESGISQSTISKIESGLKPISPTEAKAIAPILGCSMKYLALGKE